jgi:hypothetical protein
VGQATDADFIDAYGYEAWSLLRSGARVDPHSLGPLYHMATEYWSRVAQRTGNKALLDQIFVGNLVPRVDIPSSDLQTVLTDAPGWAMFGAAFLTDKGVRGAIGRVASGVRARITGRGSGKPDLPTRRVDRARLPSIAANIQAAQTTGHPSILTRTTDPRVIAANRAAACRGFCGPGSPDEYPFASTIEGGSGARVASVPLAEQRVQGGLLRAFYEGSNIADGGRFRVIVIGD